MKRLHPLVEAGLHIAVLAALAITQPLFDIIARNPGFLLARRPDPVDILLLTLALAALPPLISISLEAAARLAGRRTHAAVHGLMAAVFAALIAIQAFNRFPMPHSWVLIPLSAGLGIGAAWMLSRYGAAKLFVTVLAPCLILFPTIFLLNSGVRPLVFPGRSHAGAPDTSPAGTPQKRPPIVFIVFDGLPLISLLDKGYGIDASRYPNFAALARGSLWFRNATTASVETLTSVPAMLEGRSPDPSAAALWLDHPGNLFALLADSYDMHVVENNTMLCPPDVCAHDISRPGALARTRNALSDLFVVYRHLVYPRELREHLPSVSLTWGDFLSDMRDVQHQRAEDSLTDRRAAFSRFVGSITPSERPTLHFLHVMLPHPPFVYLPSGRRYQDRGHLSKRGTVIPGRRFFDARWVEDEFRIRQIQQRHLLQIGLTDRLLGELAARLRKIGLYDRCLLVITSDHGMSFRPGGLRSELSEETAEDLLPIPLFVKLPSQTQGRTLDRNVEHIDLLPTIAEVIGLPLSAEIDGRSALNGSAGARAHKTALAKKGIRLRFDAGFDRKRRALERRVKVFGSGDGWKGVYRIGPSPELLGRSPSSLPRGPALPFEVEIEQSAILSEPHPSLSPALLTGRVLLSGAEGRRFDLAFAVGGKVRATTRARVVKGGAARFSVMIPEDAFTPGANSVEVFALMRNKRKIFLSELRTDLRSLKIEDASDGSGKVIVSSDRRRYPVREGLLRGRVERAYAVQDSVVLQGWAVDAAGKALPESILVFSGERFLFRGTAGIGRPDIASPESDGLPPNPGFEIVIPRKLIGDLSKAEIRVFALSSKGGASELSYWKP
ncbi:MAG: sulfatase-like hydrolase/transferase [Elusimicrobiota bacterium]